MELAEAPRARPLRAIIVAGLALVALGMATGPSAGATGSISIEQTAEPFEGECVPVLVGRAAWTYAVDSTADHFRLTIHNPSTLCEAVDATAAIYVMPENGSWPQRLAATEDVTIREASTTVVTFTKDCQPVQFDVLTGETPDVIDVLGPHHGPLLFPGALDTSEQHRAPGCATTTTTTAVTTSTVAPESTTSTPTTSTPSTSTTTSIASVAGASVDSTPPPAAGASVDQERAGGSQPQVLGATATRSGASTLALTGGDLAALAGVACLVLAAGTGAVLAARRRQADAARADGA